jgi:hypothetical protein
MPHTHTSKVLEEPMPYTHTSWKNSCRTHAQARSWKNSCHAHAQARSWKNPCHAHAQARAWKNSCRTHAHTHTRTSKTIEEHMPNDQIVTRVRLKAIAMKHMIKMQHQNAAGPHVFARLAQISSDPGRSRGSAAKANASHLSPYHEGFFPVPHVTSSGTDQPLWGLLAISMN